MSWVGLVKWIVEYDIAAKKAVSLVAGLIAAATLYLTRDTHGILRSVRNEFGLVGVAVALMVVAVIVFLVTHLVFGVVSAGRDKRCTIQRAQAEDERRRATMEQTLTCLTPWQRAFLLRLLREGRRQIPEWEVGQYRAAWDFEMEVLVRKGIVYDHGGMYEIAPDYYRCVQDIVERQQRVEG
jgi:hypothetical protein